MQKDSYFNNIQLARYITNESLVNFLLKYIHASFLLIGKMITVCIIFTELVILHKYKITGNKVITRNKNLFKNFNVRFYPNRF